MRIDILTLFPEMFEGVFSQSILKRAVAKGHLELHTHDIRDYTKDKHRKVDDYPFGGGAGMVMMVQPIADCIAKLKSERNYDAVLYMAPDGHTFNQSKANELSMYENLIILCGHYKGTCRCCSNRTETANSANGMATVSVSRYSRWSSIMRKTVP